MVQTHVAAEASPNLRDDDWLYGGEPENIKTTLLNGRQGAMPAWGEMLSKDQIFQSYELR